MPPLEPRVARYLDRLGLFFEERGGSRSAGRILGWLLLSEEPQSLDDLVAALGISKAAASQGTRLWERSGLAERVSRPGDRKRYYQVDPGFQRSLARVGLEKFAALADLLGEGRRLLGPERPGARARLAGMERLYRRLAQRVPELLDELEE